MLLCRRSIPRFSVTRAWFRLIHASVNSATFLLESCDTVKLSLSLFSALIKIPAEITCMMPSTSSTEIRRVMTFIRLNMRSLLYAGYCLTCIYRQARRVVYCLSTFKNFRKKFSKSIQELFSQQVFHFQ